MPHETTAQGTRAPVFWRRQIDPQHLGLVITILAALGSTYVVMCVKTLVAGEGMYGFADFHALWVSGVLAHDGRPLVNYDEAALHAEQVARGIDAHHYNPFPYPPTLLMLLAPLGGLSLPWAFMAFMGGSAALYLAAMTWGRARDWRWWAGALAAPAGGIALVSGQSGFLSGALAVGGLRLATRRPVLAGVLFGLLAFKPQLGLLIPVVLAAAGLWRVVVSAAATVLACVALSSLAFGWETWPAWVHQMAAYAGGYDVALHLMPTIFAGARQVGAPEWAAVSVQAVATLIVAVVVWRAARGGLTEQAAALTLVGTFLATPHALNYDMPMMTAAIVGFVVARSDANQPMRLGETLVAALAFLWPFAILALHAKLACLYWAPVALLFALLARPDAWRRASP